MKLRTVALLGTAALAAAGCGSSSSKPAASGAPATAASGSHPSGTHQLVGTFVPDAGQCSSATGVPSGSYLEMLGGGGAVVKNSFGGCTNPAYSPLKPGTKGLVTGSYQPSPPDVILGPTNFFGSNFTVNTAEVDAQTKTKVPPPAIESNGGQLSGNLSAISVAYNGAYFNQGAPKPDGTMPGSTKALTGTISCDGSFTMQWQSQIVGGAFNNFTGIWHLSGHFQPASGSISQAVGC